MAEKILKTRRQFTSTLRTQLYKELRQYSEETDIPLSKLFDRAIEQFLERNKKEPSDE